MVHKVSPEPQSSPVFRIWSLTMRSPTTAYSFVHSANSYIQSRKAPGTKPGSRRREA